MGIVHILVRWVGPPPNVREFRQSLDGLAGLIWDRAVWDGAAEHDRKPEP